MSKNSTGERDPEPVDGTQDAPVPDADLPTDDLVLATARRIIAADAAIIHRLGTI